MALQTEEIAARIRELREQKGNPPQTVVASRIGVGERTYQTWENAEAKPAYRNLERLAEFYGVSEDYILSGETVRPEDPVVVSETVTGGFTEFREYVSQILGELQALRAREQDMQTLIDRQNANLAAQTRILERMQRALGITAPAEDAEHPPVRIPGASRTTDADRERSSGSGRRGDSRAS